MRIVTNATVPLACAAMLLFACGSEPPPPELGSSHSSLLGAIDYGGDCTGAMQTFHDKLVRYGRVAAASRAFRECMQEATDNGLENWLGREVGPYRQCTGDPWYGESLDTQVDRILDMSLSPNDLRVDCTGGGGNASVSSRDVHGYQHANDETFSWGGWLASVEAQLGQPVCEAAGCRFAPYPWPYSQAAGIVWHEASHTHGYTHGANDQAAAAPACGYASDPDWHFQVNTMPYIVGNCIQEVLQRSGDECGSGVEDDLETCGARGLNLVNGLDSETCACVGDPAAPSERYQILIREAANQEEVDHTVCRAQELQARVVPLDPACTRARFTVVHDRVALVTRYANVYEWVDLDVGANSGRLELRVECGGVSRTRTFYRDTARPSLTGVLVDGRPRWANNPVSLTVRGASDDGGWARRDFETTVWLDGTYFGVFDGQGADLGSLAEGEHTARILLRDGCGRASRQRSITFNVDDRAPTLRFTNPRTGARVRGYSSLTVEVVAGDPGLIPMHLDKISGVVSAKLYLDGIPGEFSRGTYLCTFPGGWPIGFARRSSCTVSANWTYGRHKLVAQIKDRAGNVTTVERDIFVSRFGGIGR